MLTLILVWVVPVPQLFLLLRQDISELIQLKSDSLALSVQLGDSFLGLAILLLASLHFINVLDISAM